VNGQALGPQLHVVQHNMNLIFHDQIHISFEHESDEGHIPKFIQIQKCFF